MTGWHSDTAFSLLFLKIAEAMEIMLIAVVSPVIRCEWQLENWQVALVTTVSDLLPELQMSHLEARASTPLPHPMGRDSKGTPPLVCWLSKLMRLQAPTSI